MRFLRLFLWFLITIVFGAIGVIWVGRELWLFIAAQNVVNDVQSLDKVNRWKGVIDGCIVDATASGPAMDGFQLRFIDNHAYDLEVKCLNTTPAVREKKPLPWGVAKTSGSAGFVYDLESRTFQGEITLEFLGQKRTVFLDDEGQPKQIWGATEYRSGLPPSVCSAYGLTCCDAELQVGSGDVWSQGVLDCSDRCFSQCLQRPLLLSFQTDPPLNYETRTASLEGSSGLILFSYQYDAKESPVTDVTVDFGDGSTQTFSSDTAKFEHEYSCRRERCQFAVEIHAKDGRGIESSTNRLSSLTVELKP